jgi:hypothetical protein
MERKSLLTNIARFIGQVLLFEAALIVVLAMIAFLAGTWNSYPTMLLLSFVLLAGGLVSAVADPVLVRTSTAQKMLISTEDVWPNRRPLSASTRHSLLAAAVGVVAILLSLIISGV